MGSAGRTIVAIARVRSGRRSIGSICRINLIAGVIAAIARARRRTLRTTPAAHLGHRQITVITELTCNAGRHFLMSTHRTGCPMTSVKAESKDVHDIQGEDSPCFNNEILKNERASNLPGWRSIVLIPGTRRSNRRATRPRGRRILTIPVGRRPPFRPAIHVITRRRRWRRLVCARWVTRRHLRRRIVPPGRRHRSRRPHSVVIVIPPWRRRSISVISWRRSWSSVFAPSRRGRSRSRSSLKRIVIVVTRLAS